MKQGVRKRISRLGMISTKYDFCRMNLNTGIINFSLADFKTTTELRKLSKNIFFLIIILFT